MMDQPQQITEIERTIHGLEETRDRLNLQIANLKELLPDKPKPKPQNSFVDPRTNKAVKIKRGR